MRRLLLTVAMLLMGAALVGGAAASLVGSTLGPLDQQVGTRASAAGAVLGIGLIVAAFNPAGSVGWVRAGILYGFAVVAFDAGRHFVWKEAFDLGPVFFGLAFSLLLIALYPERKKLMPSTPSRRAPVAPPPPAPKPKEETPKAEDGAKAPNSSV
jgi:hypothetical protein